MEQGTICLKSLSERNIQVKDKTFSHYKNVDKEYSEHDAFLEYWIFDTISYIKNIYHILNIVYTFTYNAIIIKDWFLFLKFRSMMFNATFNNISVISWQSALLVTETGVQRKPPTCQKSLKTLSHNVASSTTCHERDSNSQLQW